MKKMLISMLAAFCMLFACVIFASAVNNTAYSSENTYVGPNLNGFDTLSLSQIDYEQIAYNQVRTINDEMQIEQICTAFLASSRASVRKPDAYENRAFVATNALENDTILYRMSEYDYLSSIYDALDWEITSDSLSFHDFTVEISDATAIASIVEEYTYFITDGFEDESFRRREYTFQLSLEGTTWKIDQVMTNDPWEEATTFAYEAINIEEAVANQLKQIADISMSDAIDIEQDENVFPQAITRYKWTYDIEAAVEYASEHYADSREGDSIFGFTSGNDCQNFASQCVWAGLGGSGNSISALPAVSTSRAGSSAKNIWCRGQCSTYYDDYYFNWAWDNVRGFARLMSSSSSGNDGPYGSASFTNAVQKAEEGDVLSVNWDGVATAHGMDHAMFVTQVTGTSGLRTKSNVKIAAHTSATNSAYQSLSSYITDRPLDAFARCYITCGYYSVPQN